MSEVDRPPHDTRLTRRTLLQAGGIGLVGALAACGTRQQGATTTRATTTVATTRPTTLQTAPPGPSRGGNLRLGVAGNGEHDIVDGQSVVAKSDQARLMAGWETLLVYDRAFSITTGGLAESVEADGATGYIIRLRKGIEFHDGKTMTADDVVYSLRRLIDPTRNLFGAVGLQSVDPKGIVKLDASTVRLGLLRPDSTAPAGLAAYAAGIVPEGYTGTGRSASDGQIGTGPFVLQSFEPGKRSVHTRFANYWREGKPYLDQVTIVDIDDDSARIDALTSGHVDAIADIPFFRTDAIAADPGLVLFENEGGGWLPLCMRIDSHPFDDVNVRRAFRLIVDRQQMVDLVLAGHGRIGNDMYAPLDPDYRSDLPQRVADIEQARSLLKHAGYNGTLAVDLRTTSEVAGMIEMCTLFAKQAKAAGVKVNVRVLDSKAFTGTAGGPNSYLNWVFSSDIWGPRLYLDQVALGSIPGAPFNETHWPPAGSSFGDLFQQAIAEPDVEQRTAIVRQMEEEEYTDGGYIIPFFNNVIDAYSAKLTGFERNRGTLNLDAYGRNFSDISFV